MIRQITPFGRNIKKALVDMGMTQRQLAAEIGVAPTYISNIIYGERPGDKYRQKIISVLGLASEQEIA